MYREAAGLLQILEISSVTGHAIRQVDGWRHGHCSLTGRGSSQGRAVVGHVIAIRSLRHALWLSGRKCGGSRIGSFLNGSTVMVLMAGKGGSASKGLLTIGIWALVGALSRMRTSMTSERAAITERLLLD